MESPLYGKQPLFKEKEREVTGGRKPNPGMRGEMREGEDFFFSRVLGIPLCLEGGEEE